MILEEAILKTNNNIKNITCNTLLSEISKTDEYYNYTLFDFINFFKIRRMRELGIIDAITERDLFTYYRKYNTKMLEKTRYKNYSDVMEQIKRDIANSLDYLKAYGINPNRNEALIKIEDLVMIDIKQTSIDEMDIKPSTILKDETLVDINRAIESHVLKTNISDLSFIRLYNFLKIQLLAEMNYISKNNTELIYSLYNIYLDTKDRKLHNELAKDPYRLIFDHPRFDLVTYIDYMIQKDYVVKKENSNYLDKMI